MFLFRYNLKSKPNIFFLNRSLPLHFFIPQGHANTIMIPVLRSIDSLLNRFDELSKCHTSFLSNFDINFPDVKNPLRDVARTKEEQQKTNANILFLVGEDRKGSIVTVEDFNRRIVKIRYHHRPPIYSSHDNVSLPRVSSRTSSVTTDSTLLLRTSHITTKTNTPQPIVPVPSIKSEVKLTNNIKPKVAPQNSPTLRRSTRSAITEFTIETINRLSKPKTYPQLPDKKSIIKHVQRRPKTHGNIKTTETFKCSTLPSNPPLSIERTKTTNVKPVPKKLKVEKILPKRTPKSTPISNFSRPLVSYAPIPTVCLSFPTQPLQRPSRIMISPKIIITNKRPMRHS